MPPPARYLICKLKKGECSGSINLISFTFPDLSSGLPIACVSLCTRLRLHAVRVWPISITHVLLHNHITIYLMHMISPGIDFCLGRESTTLQGRKQFAVDRRLVLMVPALPLFPAIRFYWQVDIFCHKWTSLWFPRVNNTEISHMIVIISGLQVKESRAIDLPDK